MENTVDWLVKGLGGLLMFALSILVGITRASLTALRSDLNSTRKEFTAMVKDLEKHCRAETSKVKDDLETFKVTAMREFATKQDLRDMEGRIVAQVNEAKDATLGRLEDLRNLVVSRGDK